jgi:hypothetical protein
MYLLSEPRTGRQGLARERKPLDSAASSFLPAPEGAARRRCVRGCATPSGLEDGWWADSVPGAHAAWLINVAPSGAEITRLSTLDTQNAPRDRTADTGGSKRLSAGRRFRGCPISRDCGCLVSATSSHGGSPRRAERTAGENGAVQLPEVRSDSVPDSRMMN